MMKAIFTLLLVVAVTIYLIATVKMFLFKKQRNKTQKHKVELTKTHMEILKEKLKELKSKHKNT